MNFSAKFCAMILCHCIYKVFNEDKFNVKHSDIELF